MAKKGGPPSVLEILIDGLLDFAEDSGLMDRIHDAFTPIVPPVKQNRRRTKRKRVSGQSEAPRRRAASKASKPHVQAHTHYDTLQVAPTASQEVIQGAYRSLSRLYHPDVPGTGSKAKMQILNEAYEILSDTKKRKAYDGTLHR